MPDASAPLTRFRDLVLADPALQERLRTIDDWEPFTAEALAVAREHDVDLTADDIAAARGRELLGWLARWA